MSAEESSNNQSNDEEVREEPAAESIPTEVEKPSNAQLAEQWKNKGNDFYKIKNYAAAVTAYSQAIDLDPLNALLLTNRAAAYLMMIQYKEAVADCDKAISIDNTCAKAYFRKATALRSLGKIDAAIDALAVGLQHDPSNNTAKQERQTLVTARDKISDVRRMVYTTRQYTVALNQIDKLIKEVGSANSSELNLMKVECLLALKRTEEAYNLSNSMMKTASSSDTNLLELRSRVLFAMADVENAFKHLQQAVRYDPDNTTIRQAYRRMKEIDDHKKQGDAAFKTAQYQDAINAYTSCLQVTNSVPADSNQFASKLYLNRATSLSKLKKHDEAIKDCTRALYINPQYLKALLKRGECYLALSTPEAIQKAIDDYERALEIETDEEQQHAIQEKIKKAKVQLKRSKRKDLYAILSIKTDATESEIRSAYRKAALKYHPDKHASRPEEEKQAAENMFKSVNEAYEVLSNPEKKARYDEGVEVEDLDNEYASAGHGHEYGGHHGHHHHHGGRAGRGGGGMGGAGGIDPNVLFQMFMQQQQQGGGGGFGGGF